MGYRPELYLVKGRKIIPVAEANNFLPVFWCVIFDNQPYTISCDNGIAYPILTIKAPVKGVPEYLMTKPALIACWQRFTEVINGYMKQGFWLELCFNDFLLSEVDDEKRITKESLETYCRNALSEPIQHMRQQSGLQMRSYDLTGFSHLPELNQIDCDGLKMNSSDVTNNSNNQKKFLQPYRTFINAFMGLLCCVCFGLSGVWFAFGEGYWLTGIISILFFGLFGSIFFYAKLQDGYAEILSSKRKADERLKNQIKNKQ